jgi:response regulator RpfG family c-di-GMP phosphodiesterase
VDVFDALATKRVYKEPWNQKDILEFIASQRGVKFDPRIVDLFLEEY